MKATISGYKYLDNDGNGQRASTLIQGNPPRVVLILDSSGSTDNNFAGDESIPDINGDYRSNTILDGEIAASGELLAYLIRGGFGKSKIGLIEFHSSATIKFDGTAEDQTAGTGIYDFYSQAQALQAGGGTSYDAALLKAEELIAGWNAGPSNIIFISDGRPNGGLNGTATAQRLISEGHNLQAFGVGRSATIEPLNAIDSDGSAYIFTRSDALFDTLNGKLVGNVLGSIDYSEPGMKDVDIYIDINGNGSLDTGEPSATTDADGNYQIEATFPADGSYEVREVVPQGFTQTEGNHWITVKSDGQQFDQINFGNTTAKAIAPPPPTPLPYADFAPPYFTNRAIKGNAITLALNEEILESKGLIEHNRFKVLINKKRVGIESYQIEPYRRLLTLTLDQAATHRDKVTIGYKDSTRDQSETVIQDFAGNDMASFGKKKVRNLTGTTTVLAIEEAQANGREIELTFNDIIDQKAPGNRSINVEVNGEKNKVKDIIIGADGMSASLLMQREIEPGAEATLSYKDAPGDQKRLVFQNELGTDLSTIKDMLINNSKREGSNPPKLMNGYGRFDEITLEFDQVLKPGPIQPGLFQIQSETGNYRVRKASVGMNSKEVILDLKDDLPSFVFGLSLSYMDMSGDQKSGIIQSKAGDDVETMTSAELLIL